jgi:YesN/AraC family two-component response regulator
MRYFVADASQPIRYVSCGNLLSKQEFLHPRRNIDTYVLIMVKEGILFITQNGISYEIQPKQYLFLIANEEHYGHASSSGKLSYLWVHFAMERSAISSENADFVVEDYGRTKENPQESYYIIPEYGEISLTQRAPLLFNQLLDLSRQDHIYSNQILNYALSLLIMEISQEFIETYNKKEQKIPPNVARIMEWIRANYYKPLSVSEIANEFGYNTNYLSALFKKSTGNTLIYFINKTRIDISKSLISNYDISIKEAAFSCGFADEKYYMKTFKKMEDMTPTQYKKAFTKKMINR